VLAAVKTEFGKFGGLLDRVNKKLQQAQKVLDVELGRSRKAMVQRLRGVESLPEMEAVAVLGIDRPEDLLPEDAERAVAE
jgi:DNA recombination protein RmuC